ncbi:hypothetical protein AeMF1_011247 [Aphanomyces euteiches]|nr:hypothetical protein AeMF1_011247 [Aphanomyces euteiches]KAH9182803.1 hypothetical protein AeNC1_015220 [Aphanomyces euteiches]
MSAVRCKDALPAFYASRATRQRSLEPNSSLEDDKPPSNNQTTASVPAATTDALVVVKDVPKEPRVATKPKRPSLSDQLASIGLQAESVARSLKKRTNDDEMTSNVERMRLPTLRMVVGRLECKFPSPIVFFDQLCRYQFVHGGRDIAMYMYYRDMTDISMEKNRLTLRFRIPHALAQFGADYDYHNQNHAIEIGFASQTDWNRVKAFLSKLQSMQKRHA